MKTISMLFTYINRERSVSHKRTKITLLLSLAIFIGVCLITYENAFNTFEGTKTLVFALSIACIFIGLFNTLPVFNTEKHHILPELRSGLYPISVYIISNFLIQVLLCMAQAILGTSILICFFYDKMFEKGLSNEYIALDVCVTFFFMIMAMAMLGFLLSLVIESISTALVVTPIILVAQFLLSGGILQLNGFLEQISEFIVCKHGLMALGSIFDINQYPLKIQESIPQFVQEPDPFYIATTTHYTDCITFIVLLLILPLALSVPVVMYKKVNRE